VIAALVTVPVVVKSVVIAGNTEPTMILLFWILKIVLEVALLLSVRFPPEVRAPPLPPELALILCTKALEVLRI